MHPLRRPFVVVAALATAASMGAGCSPPFKVTDSFTPPSDGLFESPPDSLHDYVVGTQVRLDVRTAQAFINLDNVEVVSKTPDLIEVLEQVRVEDELRVLVRALAEGPASLAFLDENQRPIEERVIEVKLPDEVQLAVNIDTDRGFTIPVLDPDGLLIATTGVATFRVTYLRDGSEVKGTNVLRSPDATTVKFENPVRLNPGREFISLTAPPDPSEPIAVPLVVAGEVITTLLVRPTGVEEVKTIQLDEGDLPAWRNDGDQSLIWSKAFTEDAVPIFGAPFAWTFDSAGLEGTGDLVTYDFAGGKRRRIQVGVGDAVADVTVEAADGSAQVSSTANAGCASTPAPPVLAALAALVLRRRRRAR